MRQKPDGSLLVQKRVIDFILFALLPSGEDFLAGIFLEKNCTVFLGVKVLGSYLLAVEEGKRRAVGQEGAELFHEIESQRGTTGAIPVEEAALGVEAAGFQRTAAIVHEQGIEKGQQGVDWIEWWTPRSS